MYAFAVCLGRSGRGHVTTIAAETRKVKSPQGGGTKKILRVRTDLFRVERRRSCTKRKQTETRPERFVLTLTDVYYTVMFKSL